MLRSHSHPHHAESHPSPVAGLSRAVAGALASALLMIGCASHRPAPEPYVFAWSFPEVEWKEPRGGDSRGPDVTLDRSPDKAWLRIQAAETPLEKDRAAILAMAGGFRVSFDFMETAVYRKDGKASPARPYRTWATERVYVVADSESFISLQHVLVQFTLDDKGGIKGPMVQKHWRQDWRYEPERISEFQGNRVWQGRTVDSAERRGAWSQSVFQVDDSPRYASLGRWEHNASFSSWMGSKTLRPLPRREHTVRKDYQALAALNRHTIAPTGWSHEQDNLKLVLDSAGRPDDLSPYLAREMGVDRYDRIKGFDFSAGDSAWKATGPYWERVRAQWDKRLVAPQRLRISEKMGGGPAFMPFFSHADSLTRDPAATRESLDADVNALLDGIVTVLP
jgi:hypothetical protein